MYCIFYHYNKRITINEVSVRMYLVISSFCKILYLRAWAWKAQSVQRLATAWTVRGSNSGGDEIFRTRPDRPWGLPILLHNRCRVSSPGVKRPGRGLDHPPSSSAEVKERVGLYLYSHSLDFRGPSRVNFTFVLTCLTMA